jgi:hypothetical protein
MLNYYCRKSLIVRRQQKPLLPSRGLKTVQEFLKLDNLNIKEVDLARALIKWGENQVKKEPEQTVNLRTKILPALPLIRFVGMSRKDVAKVCMEELAAVLTAEEKLQIMQSSLLKDKELLPLNFTKSPARPKQIPEKNICTFLRTPGPRQVHLVDLSYKRSNKRGNYKKKPFSYRMEFRVDRRATLVGLNLGAGTAKKREFFFTVFTSKSGKALACGDSNTILDHANGQCFKVTPEIELRPCCYFSIQFAFPLIQKNHGVLKNHHAPLELISTNGLPIVTLTAGIDVLFPIRSLVFDGP